jgi:murein DD-endopeptidase MepM/ murein hydrolase activator NlpD
MIRFFILFLLTTSLFSASVEHFKWENGETYSGFLERHNLPRNELLHDLNGDDAKLIEEVRAGFNCHMLKSSSGEIEQILIPMNDELQLHIYKTQKSYAFEAIPIISETRVESLSLKIQTNPSVDIKNLTGSYNLVSIFSNAYKKSLDFTALQKGDNLVMIYEQKYRLGKPFSMPTLLVGMIETNKKPNYIYLNKDELYYDKDGKQIEGFLLSQPVSGARISSRFTKRRFHPILKRWKAHTGVDFAARRGTPIKAAGSGTVSFVGWKGGYGKTIQIKHTDGYVTLYAHQKSFRNGMKRGKSVKQGQVIGYVGNTGRSTGPHLHFGLYKNGTPIDPLKVVQITTKKLKEKERKAFIELRDNYNKEVATILKEQPTYIPVADFANECYFYNKEPLEVASNNG